MIASYLTNLMKDNYLPKGGSIKYPHYAIDPYQTYDFLSISSFRANSLNKVYWWLSQIFGNHFSLFFYEVVLIERYTVYNFDFADNYSGFLYSFLEPASVSDFWLDYDDDTFKSDSDQSNEDHPKSHQFISGINLAGLLSQINKDGSIPQGAKNNFYDGSLDNPSSVFSLNNKVTVTANSDTTVTFYKVRNNDTNEHQYLFDRVKILDKIEIFIPKNTTKTIDFSNLSINSIVVNGDLDIENQIKNNIVADDNTLDNADKYLLWKDREFTDGLKDQYLAAFDNSLNEVVSHITYEISVDSILDESIVSKIFFRSEISIKFLEVSYMPRPEWLTGLYLSYANNNWVKNIIEITNELGYEPILIKNSSNRLRILSPIRLSFFLTRNYESVSKYFNTFEEFCFSNNGLVDFSDAVKSVSNVFSLSASSQSNIFGQNEPPFDSWNVPSGALMIFLPTAINDVFHKKITGINKGALGYIQYWESSNTCNDLGNGDLDFSLTTTDITYRYYNTECNIVLERFKNIEDNLQDFSNGLLDNSFPIGDASKLFNTLHFDVEQPNTQIWFNPNHTKTVLKEITGQINIDASVKGAYSTAGRTANCIDIKDVSNYLPRSVWTLNLQNIDSSSYQVNNPFPQNDSFNTVYNDIIDIDYGVDRLLFNQNIINKITTSWTIIYPYELEQEIKIIYNQIFNPVSENIYKDFFMPDSPRIKEIHAALEAQKYASYTSTKTGEEKPRVANIGYYVERIARILGINVLADGAAYTPKAPDLAPATDDDPDTFLTEIPAPYQSEKWGLGKEDLSIYQLSTGGLDEEGFPNLVDTDAPTDNIEYDAIIYEFMSSKFVLDDKSGEKTNIVPTGYGLVHNIPQLIRQMLDDFDKGLGIQESSAFALRSAEDAVDANGNTVPKICTYEGLHAAIAEALYMNSEISRRASSTQFSSLTTQACVYELMGILGLPVEPKYFEAVLGEDLETGEDKRYKIYHPAFSNNAPRIFELWTTLMQNIAPLLGNNYTLDEETQKQLQSLNTEELQSFIEELKAQITGGE